MRHVACLLFAVVVVGQEGGPAPQSRPDAAAIYRLALDELQQRFGIAAEGALELPWAADGETDTSQRRFASADFAPLLARAATAMTLFAQAARIEACEFPPAKKPLSTGYDEVSLQLYQLAQLVAAHGCRQLPTAPAAALADVVTLLGHARHAMRQPTAGGGLLGTTTEAHGMLLLQATIEAAPADARLRADCLALVEEHARKRATNAELADHAETEIVRLLATTLAKGADEPAPATEKPADQVVRTHAAEVAANVRRITREHLAVLHRDPPASVAEVRAAHEQMVARLQEGTSRKEIERLDQMTPEQAIDVLSRRLALMMLPDVAAMAEREAAAQQGLQRCRDLLVPVPQGK